MKGAEFRYYFLCSINVTNSISTCNLHNTVFSHRCSAHYVCYKQVQRRGDDNKFVFKNESPFETSLCMKLSYNVFSYSSLDSTFHIESRSTKSLLRKVFRDTTYCQRLNPSIKVNNIPVVFMHCEKQFMNLEVTHNW